MTRLARPAQLAASVSLGLLLVVGVLAAAALGAPGGRPPARERPAPSPPLFSMTGNVDGLLPGLSTTLPVTVRNEQSYDIRVTGVRATAADASAACAATAISIGSFAGAIVVPARGTVTVSLPVAMDPSAPQACEAVTFPVDYVGDAEPARLR